MKNKPKAYIVVVVIVCCLCALAWGTVMLVSNRRSVVVAPLFESVDLGMIERGSVRRIALERVGTSAEAAPVIERVVVNRPWIEPVVTTEVLADGIQQAVELEVDAFLPPGPLRENIVIVYEVGANRADEVVSVSGEIFEAGPLLAAQHIDFGVVSLDGGSVTRSVMVLNRGGVPGGAGWEIVRVEAKDGVTGEYRDGEVQVSLDAAVLPLGQWSGSAEVVYQQFGVRKAKLIALSASVRPNGFEAASVGVFVGAFEPGGMVWLPLTRLVGDGLRLRSELKYKLLRGGEDHGPIEPKVGREGIVGVAWVVPESAGMFVDVVRVEALDGELLWETRVGGVVRVASAEANT